MSMPVTLRPSPTVLAVIVTYHPNRERLTALVDRVRPQVDAVLVVDNGSGLTPGWPESLGVTALELGCNTGIAGAINRGIDHMMAGSWTHLLTLDQDSLPAPDMVARLLEAEGRLLANGTPVAAVGPVHEDPRTGTLAACERLDGWKRVWIVPTQDECPVVNHVISSGMLVRHAVLTSVGPMREALFIDYVDIEWCVRAQSQGLCAVAVGAARMTHTIGDRVVYQGRRSLLTAHSPIRNYYMARNAVEMLRHPKAPLGWKVVIARDLVIRTILYTVLMKPHLPRVGQFVRGIWHGLIGRLGPAP